MNDKFSYTTGTYAAAAAKAAVKNLLGENHLENVEVKLPANEKAEIPVNHTKQKKNCAECGVIKKSIEETDVTNNMEIIARVSFREDDQIIIDGGDGIGRVTKP
jgi:cobalt-precorrin-5B (C1)-methyltransferase